MPLSYLFWGIYIFAILFAWWLSYDGQANWYRRAGTLTVLWVLVGILGYRVFGSAIR
jgi:hypothetical protein